MRAQRAVAHKFQKFRQRRRNIRRAHEHRVGNAGQLDDLRVQKPPRCDERLEFFQHLAVLHARRADLNDDVVLRRKPRRFQIERHIFAAHRRVQRAVDGDAVVNIVYIISLAAVENLDILLRARDLCLARRLHRVRERVDAAVVGDGDGAMPPRRGALDRVGGLGQRVHGGHRRMQMQLHALFGRGIAALGRGDLADGVRLHHHFVVIAVKGHLALDRHPHSGGFDLFQNGLCLVRLHELVHAHRAGVVRHIKAHHPRAALFQLPVVDRKDLALHAHAVHIEVQVFHRRGLGAEGSAEDPVLRHGGGRLCRALLGGGDHRRVFHRLAADTLRFGKQLLCRALAVRVDLDRHIHAEALLDKPLDLRNVLQQLRTPVGGQMHVNTLARDLPPRPGKARRRRGIRLRECAVQRPRRQRLQRAFGIMHLQFQRPQPVPLFDRGAGCVQQFFSYVNLRAQLQRDRPRRAVELRVAQPQPGQQ